MSYGVVSDSKISSCVASDGFPSLERNAEIGIGFRGNAAHEWRASGGHTSFLVEIIFDFLSSRISYINDQI